MITNHKMIELDPKEMAINERYKILIGSVVPRPIAFVSTCNADGKTNLAPFSYFNVVCTDPPTLLFCPNIRGTDGQKKDTLRNIEEIGEFVINIVTEDIVEQMNQTAGEYPPEVSEFEISGLTPEPSSIVKPPKVKESPIQFECKLQQVIPVGSGNVGSGFIVLGTIVRFHLREDVYQNGHVLIEQLKPVARLAGNTYCPVHDIFEIARPTVN
jgi:flavin reductase (DIM6/NTAB) family NADH-FMN oxidoreductase RutF